MFSDEINKAINEKQNRLPEIEQKIYSLQESFKDEQAFVDTFASGDTRDVIALSVIGTVMTTKRSTLLTVKESALARRFDNSKWTEQGLVPRVLTCGLLRMFNIGSKTSQTFINMWISVFKEMTGCELQTLCSQDLNVMDIDAGTVAIIQKEIEVLKDASQESLSLIDHCPNCFGLILDFLRWKQLHAHGLVQDKPKAPDVPEGLQKRFKKIVNFFFPGDSAELFL